ncbi:matrixin family metalloprotease [Nostocoides sp. Soil756]|jgi:predicted Zn-dependent protease|uniref:matrixin family metalloprotease n=1 Tax=Nostocoides sp. Soil756 TaxID=1736399 RepID=UPI00070004CB|nr:matrixin family metalloprotease [Tetrasphaera sp. Soil756]KRE60147.1 hypothetical protein ASG78_15725 [Tetrasphaera sp. Soil756]
MAEQDTAIHSLARGFRFVAALLVAVGLVMTNAVAAHANFSGANGKTGCSGGSPVNMADGGTHNFNYVSLNSAVQSAVAWSRTYNYDSTDVNTGYDSTLDPTTDVIVRNQDYTTYCGFSWHPGSTVGLTTCDSLSGGFKCESHTVRFDISYFNAANQSQERGLACHEIGHSLGLTHRDAETGCMETYLTYPTYLTDHDEAHLNANY